jgi:predicted Rossmann-fold nucleotide-binding protein
MTDRKIFIGVIGAGACTDEVARLAGEVGEGIAKAGAVLVCGGMGGVMEAACKGAKRQNLLVVRNSDAVIALPGEFGTLSEIAFSLRLGKPVVGLSTWQVSDKIIQAKNPAEAVSVALVRARASRSEL